MSELQHKPLVPDTMPYREDERELARQKQQEDKGRELARQKQDTLKAAKKRRNKIIASIGGGAAMLTGGFLAANSLGNQTSSPEPRTEPSSSASVKPGENSTNPEINPDEASFAFAFEVYKDDPIALINKFYENMNERENINLTPAIINADERFEVTDEIYAQQLAAASEAQYINDIYVSDWQSNPNLVNNVNSSKAIHESNIRLALATSDPDNGDIEPYKRFTNLIEESIKVDSQSDSEFVISSRWKGSDNSDKNRGDELLSGEDPNSSTGGSTVRFIVEDGQFKLADITHYSG